MTEAAAMIFEVRNVEPNVAMVVIDGISIPVDLYTEAKKLATGSRKTHFVGVMQKKRENVKPEETANLHELFASITKSPLGMIERYCQNTGEYVISSDRDLVLDHGCGLLVWVTPWGER